MKNNLVWLGCCSGSKVYTVSDSYAQEYPDKVFFQDGQYVIKMGNTGWFTNIDHAKRHQMLPLGLGFTYAGHEEDYPKYDNYAAIEVSKVSQIPCDYMGVMGVPITFLDKYCPAQFEIVGATESEGRGFSAGLWDNTSGVSQPLVNKSRVYKRIFIRRR